MTTQPDSVSEEHVNLNEGCGGNGGFTSLLNSQAPNGFLALGGFGLGVGVGHGFDEIGFGYGRGVWPFPEVGDFGSGNSGGGSGATSACNTWQQMSGSDGGLVDGDCFAWPELAISMPGKGLK